MIKDNRLPSEIGTAIEQLQAIKEVYERDGQIHEDYVEEKLQLPEGVIKWTHIICDKAREAKNEL